jgi:D-alanine-D-alanine ligase
VTWFDAAPYGRLALACGGDSAEREISLRSGRAVAAALTRSGIAHEVFDGARAVIDAARDGHIDGVLNMLHGRGGEDGCLQGALALYSVPITGSGVLASALTMDKLQTKRVWRAEGLPTPDWHVAGNPDDVDRIAAGLELPVFVKPACEGSSVGMSRVLEAAQLKPAVEIALRHDATALIERMIQGPEYTAAILDDGPLPLIRIATPREFYDFDAKYEAGDTEYHCPCGLPGTRESELQSLALQAFEVLGCSGWGRVDFMLDRSGRPWLLEANTVPGMTDHSLVPMAAAVAGLNFDALVHRLLKTMGGTECSV